MPQHFSKHHYIRLSLVSMLLLGIVACGGSANTAENGGNVTANSTWDSAKWDNSTWK